MLRRSAPDKDREQFGFRESLHTEVRMLRLCKKPRTVRFFNKTKNANLLKVSVLLNKKKVNSVHLLRRERYHSQKEMTLIYLLFNELSTIYLAFPIKTVQIL